ncbi:MAG: hypothetical protein APR56_05225 [Methanosaeta sp. SDB]|nr:MAG: hypothetical protein APR56_05225 [Methanosaeta sp. SDB]
MILAISLISGLSTAEDSNLSMNDSEVQPAVVVEPTVAEATDVETVAPEGAATSDEAEVADVKALEGSWILNMDDAQISMVIYQSVDLLFGAANSETPKPWNGVVSGMAYEDEVELEILSLQDGVLVSTLIAGIATEGTLSGSFVQSDSEGKVNKGSVMGFLTSPETSGYEPADVPTAAATTVAAAVTPAPESTTTTTTTETTTDGRKTPVDVVTLKDTIPYSPFGI